MVRSYGATATGVVDSEIVDAGHLRVLYAE